MRTTLYFLLALTVFGLGACNKFKTDAVTGREFLLRQGPKSQHFGPGVTQFIGENGMSFLMSGPYVSLQSGDTLVGSPEFWLTEYTDEKAMMYGHMATISNGQVLSTAGAFKLITRINGELVRPSNLEFGVPSSTQFPDMELFYGLPNSEQGFNWNPFELGGVLPVSWRDTIGLGIANFGGSGPGYQGYISPLDSYYNDDGALFINCDYFPSWGIPLTDIMVRTSADESFTPLQLDVSLLFDSLNVYMPGTWIPANDGHHFYNVPIGYNVHCLATAVNNEQELFFGMLSFAIEEDGVYTFGMNPITEEELEDILDGL